MNAAEDAKRSNPPEEAPMDAQDAQQIAKTLREQGEHEREEHMTVLMAAIEPDRPAVVQPPEPTPREKFAGINRAPFYDARLDPISPHFDLRTWHTDYHRPGCDWMEPRHD